MTDSVSSSKAAEATDVLGHMTSYVVTSHLWSVYQELATCQELYIAHLILSLCVLFVFTTCESACVEVDGCTCA